MIAASRRGSSWRLIVSALVAAAGLVDVISAMVPAERARLLTLREYAPLVATRVATGATVVAGVALLVLARQISRGKRRAMVLTEILLTGSVALHFLKGLDFEEAAFAAAIAILIALRRRDFHAEGDPASLSLFLRVAPMLSVGIFAFGVAAIWVNRSHVTQAFGFWSAARQAAGSMVLVGGPLELSGRFEDWYPVTMAVLGIGSAAYLAFLLFRPVVGRLHQRPEDRIAARTLVRAADGDSLSYFALRGDKDYFFNSHRSAMLAYRYVAGLALVSGDPIGPRGEWPELLEEFIGFCRRHDWRIAIAAAGESATPLYRGFGFRLIEMGDEAVVDCRSFSLEGRRMRNVRQSGNHIRGLGYSFTLLEQKELEAGMRREMLAISARWRGKAPERGFSMALGRLLSPEDSACLVAVAVAPNGIPDAFLQLVPYNRGKGYSLDAMRRNPGGPAGLMEFLVSEAVAGLRARGCESLSLNFAMFSKMLAPVEGLHPARRAQRRVILLLSRWFQIESLYRFNAKFDPKWHPRYMAYEEPLGLFRAGLALAQAEAFLKLPFVGRYF